MNKVTSQLKNLSSFITLILLLLLNSSVFGAENYRVKSPDETITIDIKITDKVYYSVAVDQEYVLWNCPVSLETNQGDLGVNPELSRKEESYIDETVNTVWGIRNQVRNEYNELRLQFTGGYSLIFRAYNDGIAYRFETELKGELIIFDEEVRYNFTGDYQMLNHIVGSIATSYESLYTRQKVTEVEFGKLVSLPSLVMAGKVKLAIVESDLFSYPGMYLTKRVDHSWPQISGTFSRFPLKAEVGGMNNFNVVVTERADYIAKTTGNRSFPWRAMVIAREDKELLDSDLVYKLARPAKIKTDWIKPGKVAWDWFNAINLSGVDFEAGINNESYEYFIDFAAENNIPYVILDEGWSDQFDLLLPSAEIDMERLTSYAEQKEVKLILWSVWHAIDRQKEEVFKLLNKWGIAGVKVDFIDRDDQLAIEFYENFAKEAAKYELMVDYHGCSKPTGLSRTYPNIINYEGVRGNEYNKFSEEPPNPVHDVNIAYARMIAGPLDYTPGNMRNATEGNFSISFENPVSQGTRCHQLGMYVVYFAPLQMLADAPTQYEKYPDILNFLSQVPTSWDETVPLAGKVGEYAVIARKKGEDWYIGGLNDWNEREITIDLSEFADGNYKAEILIDGINANRMAEDYRYKEKQLNSADKFNITMKNGGGFAIILKKQ